MLRDRAERGGVIIASMEYEDLARVCDRVLALVRGRLSEELGPGTLSVEALIAAARADR